MGSAGDAQRHLGFQDERQQLEIPANLIRQLVDIASKGGNFLLNVGPTSAGEIPEPSVERLKKVGEWLQVNGDAVYGAKPSPYPNEFDWGSVTSKNGRLFLDIVEWPKNGKFILYGLDNKVQQAALVSKAGPPLKFTHQEERPKNLI